MRQSKSSKKHSHRVRHTTSVVLVLLIISYVITILLLPLKPIYATNLASPVTASGQLSVVWPNSKQASIGVLGSGTLISNGSQLPTPTASIAKVVTALTVLKKYPLTVGQQGPTITINSSDVADYNSFVAQDGSVIKVVAGEQITEYQALQAMLLPSANNMADTLAIWAYGSTANYIVAANAYVKSLNMSTTIISDPSGFSPNTVSTSADLIKLGEAALSNQVVAQIVDQTSAILPVAGIVKNVDFYLGVDSLIGIKTGNTDQAGGCFLSAAKYDLGGGNSITVIGAVMNAPNLHQALIQTIPMLRSVKNQIVLKTLPAETAISTYKLPWGESINSVTKSSIAIPYLPQLPISYSNISNKVIPPKNIDTQVGSVSLGVGNDKNRTALVLNQNITKPSIFWRLTHPQYFI